MHEILHLHGIQGRLCSLVPFMKRKYFSACGRAFQCKVAEFIPSEDNVRQTWCSYRNGGACLLPELPGGGLWGSAGAVHWLQLSHDLGLSLLWDPENKTLL